ncbi:MAG: MarR family transcriptional regulator [Clostridia bacterium]|nr:MarR family transcriptional regulator [Clostridia bacterium]
MSNEFKEHLGSGMSNTLMGYYIDMMSKIEKSIFDEAFDKIDITLSQFKVLNWLWRKGPLTQKEIHNYVNIKPSSLTKMLDILIKKGLVERESDPDDARIKIVKATEKAAAIEHDAWDVVINFDQRIRSILSEEEYEMTINSLRKLTEELK